MNGTMRILEPSIPIQLLYMYTCSIYEYVSNHIQSSTIGSIMNQLGEYIMHALATRNG